MRLLLLLVVVLAVVWVFRSRRPPSVASRPPRHDGVDTMLACAQCGVHLPRSEALPGRGGVFCSEPHRTLYEKSHPLV